MKRRSFFTALLAGAAAFVVPAGKAAAEEDSGIHEFQNPHLADIELSTRCLACDWRSEWSSEINFERAHRTVLSFGRHVAEAHGGAPTNSETNWRPRQDVDAIAQARAEGYERGRAIEAAKHESRVIRNGVGNYTVTWHPLDDPSRFESGV